MMTAIPRRHSANRKGAEKYARAMYAPRSDVGIAPTAVQHAGVFFSVDLISRLVSGTNSAHPR